MPSDRRAVKLMLCALTVAACGGEATVPGSVADAAVADASMADVFAADGPSDEARPAPVSVPFKLLFGVPVVDVAVNDGDAVPMVVDTGAPVTFLNAALTNVTAPARTPPTLRIGGALLTAVPAVLGDPLGLGSRVGGVLGASALLDRAQTFDFRASTWTLGDAPRPQATRDDETTVPFRLEGGGLGLFPPRQQIRLPANRLVVTAQIDGRSLRLMVDTGAAAIVLRPEAFAAVAADGRAQATLTTITQAGPVPQSFVRARSVTLGGAAVDGLPVGSFSTELLDGISAKVGSTVDGLLGEPFLREFAVTIDYPHGLLRLRRYTDRGHIHDEFRRVGVRLSRDLVGRHRVGYVFPGSDAERAGLRVGDVVSSVNDRDLADLDDDEAGVLLSGAPGEMRTLLVGGRTVVTRVDELLPLP